MKNENRLKSHTLEDVIVQNQCVWKSIVNASNQELNAQTFVNAKDVRTIIIDTLEGNQKFKLMRNDHECLWDYEIFK